MTTTALMPNHSFFACVFLLVVGLSIAWLGFRDHDVEERNAYASSHGGIMETPMIGGGEARKEFSRQGPWPHCVGEEGSYCVRHIEAAAKDVRGNVLLFGPEDEAPTDFDGKRVKVFVDEDSVVLSIPERG